MNLLNAYFVTFPRYGLKGAGGDLPFAAVGSVIIFKPLLTLAWIENRVFYLDITVSPLVIPSFLRNITMTL